ncbi:hypothetical protein [Gluconobacter cerinus]|uniref:hypothetical protein n=1 Tax=Gluconobacter cerinus TaxID=38307 RepID=UPI001B8BBFBC|nr:hypothetical protein [Gluconobacter cerinus]MBS1039012.1 hypothetical protein [Gluconobacter cerinus]
MSDLHIVPLSTGAYALVCERVRHEADGKKTFIGVSSGTFSLEKNQQEISFDLYVSLQILASEHPKTMQVAVCRNDTIVAVPIKEHSIVYSKSNKSEKNTSDGVAVKIFEVDTSVEGLQFSDGDLLSVLVGLDDKSYVAAAMTVVAAKPFLNRAFPATL